MGNSSELVNIESPLDSDMRIAEINFWEVINIKITKEEVAIIDQFQFVAYMFAMMIIVAIDNRVQLKFMFKVLVFKQVINITMINIIMFINKLVIMGFFIIIIIHIIVMIIITSLEYHQAIYMNSEPI